MRKKINVFLCVLLVVSMFAGITASAQQPIRVVLDGRTLQFDVPPTTIDGRTMVPMRVIFEALGAEINWNDRTRTITATRDNLTIIATIGSRTMTVNGARTEMDVAPTIIDGRTLVPVRFVSEAFGTEVEWDAGARTVQIKSETSNVQANVGNDWEDGSGNIVELPEDTVFTEEWDDPDWPDWIWEL